MKSIILCFLFLIYISFASSAQSLTWAEHFRKKNINTKFWSIIPRGASQWDRYMSDAPELYKIKRGVINLGVSYPDTNIITGGIYTKGKIHFRYGRLEIKAKIRCAQGIWPAIWMKPVDDIKTPYGGEFDIMEHLNYDGFIYQTVHSGYTLENKNRGQQNYAKTPVNLKKYNIYAIEHHRDYIAFFINGVETLRYNRNKSDTDFQWPFDRDYFLMIDTQAGGDWAGPVNISELPTFIYIDWVKYYEFQK